MQTNDGAEIEVEDIGVFPIVGNEAVAFELLTHEGSKGTALSPTNPLDQIRADLLRAFSPRKARTIAAEVAHEQVLSLERHSDLSRVELISSVFVPAAARALFRSLNIDHPRAVDDLCALFSAAQASNDVKSSLSERITAIASGVATSVSQRDATPLTTPVGEHQLSESGAAHVVELLIMAGVEPVANLAAMTLSDFLENREGEAGQTTESVRAAYERTICDNSPIYPGLYRASSAELVVNGHVHPAGTMFLIPAVSAEQVGEESKDRRHFTFGAGTRRCVAESLAERLVIELVSRLADRGASHSIHTVWRAGLPRGIRSMRCGFSSAGTL
ncbi:hypothetical protein [Prescottella agglutinans]|uniref:hypothetical protein n=1 Tax=Prescottella agglutinans TaxID=1644129 RepID=UPI003D96E49F